MPLRDALLAAGYTADGVLGRIGELGQEGLGRNVTVPAAAALEGERDELATLIRLFILQLQVPAADVAFLEGEADEYLSFEEDGVRAKVDVRPYGSDDDAASGWVVSDLTPGLDTVTAPTRPDYVLGVSSASTTLAQLTMRTPVGSALDLGTGCGVQALHLARHAGRVVATDLNERAVELARRTAELNDVDVDFRVGSLFEPVVGERFDLIVSNPPYVMSPPSADEESLAYRETNLVGDELLRILLREGPRYLNPGGSMQLLTNWAIVAGETWEERITRFLGDATVDVWAIERERMDKYGYIELWLTDAGLAGSPEWRPAYERWLAYFDELGITEVGMGWMLVTNSGRATPHRRFESWPYAVQQPVSEVFARHRAAVDAATMELPQLLESTPALKHVQQETIGEPGAADPQHIVFRQTTGLRRGLEADTALAAVLGALDGSLSIARVAQAVAHLLELSPAELLAELVPRLREALEEQYLDPGER